MAPDQPVEPDEVERVLDWLIANDLQSDARFTESVLRQVGSRQGRRTIQSTLAAAGVGNELIEQHTASLAQTELARAQALWQHRFGELPIDIREQARQSRFLLSRGFSHDVVARVLRGRGTA